MSIESYLSRELDIRFIDARMLVNEAKLKLNLMGYVDKQNQASIQAEAKRLFEQRSLNEQQNLKRANWDLEAIKIPNWSMSMSAWQDSAMSDIYSDHSEVSDCSRRSTESNLKPCRVPSHHQ